MLGCGHEHPVWGRTMAVANRIAEADFYSTDLISPLTETVPA